MYLSNNSLSKDFSTITIGISSPDAILSRSYGEVTKAETINYRSFKPEKDGLFCEKIFGPVKDWECHCGKYKRIRYKGIICDRCGVEVTLKAVRRERMGHISLAVPVVHIWFFKSLPSKIGSLLGLSIKQLEKIIYYENYIVVQPGKSGLKYKDIIPEEELYRVKEELGLDNENLPNTDPNKFIALIGGEAVKELLKRVDVEQICIDLRKVLRDPSTSIQKRSDALRQLRVADAFRLSEGAIENRPEWMVLDVVPVIPPELRPLVPLEGGRFATSDLNDLYRRVIIRNNRLRKLIEIRAPEVILRNEKRMLQESVDSLFDNSRKTAAVRSDSNRPLKSLSDMLKGKQGRFRQNLLGKRVDYSGRSVIVVGPELKLHECGLPKEMAVELFKPFIIRKLVERGYVKTVKSAKRMVDKHGAEVWEILEKIVSDHPVMLNRAPTLHRLGIQAFQPVLVEGRAIQVHPLVCAAFNADFDGDQMAVHIPLSYEAQIEARMLMLSSHNIIQPSSGRPIAIPSQDIVLGNYYLTKAKPGARGEGMRFSSIAEVRQAFDNGVAELHAKIKLRYIKGEGKTATVAYIDTTVGRSLFNEIIPKEMGFVNELMTKKKIEETVSRMHRAAGNLKTVEFLDNLKMLGFMTATRAGVSIGIEDVLTPPNKEGVLKQASSQVEKVQKTYRMGLMTDGERYNKIIDIWTHASNDVAASMYESTQTDRGGFNPIFMMMDSGARGSRDQIKQLGGMRGLMSKPQKSMTGQVGEIIENPITASFKEGLSVWEYFISTHGARKGLADTALKTADAGYLTRRLVDVAQDVIITEDDCGTILGVKTMAIKEGEEIKESLGERCLGRVAADDVIDPSTGKVAIEAGELIDEAKAEMLNNSAIEMVEIRSVLTCESKRGVCAKCYGRNLATGNVVNMGEAVGVMAAQSIGEPGTQLTLRTFHIGGVAARVGELPQALSKSDGKVVFAPGMKMLERQTDGIVISLSRNGRIELLDEDRLVYAYKVPYGAELSVHDGQKVKKDDLIMTWDPYNTPIISEHDGIVHYEGLKEGVTCREEADEATGMKHLVVIESRDKKMTPSVVIKKGREVLETHILPTRAYLVIKDGEEVHAGEAVAKIPREMAKTKDITGGLPRVQELFEARRPKDSSAVAEIDGTVKIGKISRGYREIMIEGKDGESKSYKIPFGKHLIVHEGDYVIAGEQMSDGSVAPHDILRIKGPAEVQRYLVNEIQEVYRTQGVKINDKHIEVIVRQMLQRVRIQDPGDTYFLQDDQVDRLRFNEENQGIRDKVVVSDKGDSNLKEGQLISRIEIEKICKKLEKKRPPQYREAQPATAEPLLLGITQASLSTESFISAASFQETTKVLADAAINGKTDYLLGLKENVIMGRLIPAGTGLKRYQDIAVSSTDVEEEAASGKKTKSAKK
ncbi:DNA-directed RNA polymerase subunit beta' [bacterium]|nr:DNA-directed RNA polymerase subunit beta' [bacterium]